MRQGIAVGAVFVLILFSFIAVSQFGASPTGDNTESAQCQVAPFREAEAESLIQEGAIIVYHRTAGPACVDQLYAIFPDGRVTGNDGVDKVEKQVSPEEVEKLLTVISVDHQWFTDEIYSTYLNPCRQCFAHYINISMMVRKADQ
jgi:hypothetical protein